MKCGVKFLHRFLRSIGFSSLTSTKEVQNLVKDVILNADNRNYTTDRENGDTVLVEFSRNFAENMGIAVCGELDEEDHFIYYYFYPYLRGTGISSLEDISIERHAATESYAGVCDDIKVGVTMIFYLQNMISYIQQNYQERIRMEDIAAAAAVSRRECIRCFQSSIQKTPFEYLLDYRLEMAERLLQNTELPIGEIALQTGFTDSAYFGKMFKKYRGMSPGQYRRQNRHQHLEPSGKILYT